MATKTIPWNFQAYLTTPEDRASMLEGVFEDNPSASEVAHILGEIARAHGQSELARQTGLTREGLRKALSKEGNPRLDTLMRILPVFGLRLAVMPLKTDETASSGEGAGMLDDILSSGLDLETVLGDRAARSAAAEAPKRKARKAA